MGYRGQSDNFTPGAVLGCLAAFAFLLTVGVMVLFATTWGCVPAHRIDGEECGRWVMPLTLLGLGGATFLVFWVFRRAGDWLWQALRRDAE